jgi:hypothetical protein
MSGRPTQNNDHQVSESEKTWRGFRIMTKTGCPWARMHGGDMSVLLFGAGTNRLERLQCCG